MTEHNEPQVPQETQEEWTVRITEIRRLTAFSDPLTGSDRFFAQAIRLDAQGQSAEANQARALGTARYQEIKEAFPLPDDSPSNPVPQRVSQAQGKLVLIGAGIWPLAVSYVEGIEDPDERLHAEVALHDTAHYERSSPFLIQMAGELGISSEQLDALFTQAAAISI